MNNFPQKFKLMNAFGEFFPYIRRKDLCVSVFKRKKDAKYQFPFDNCQQRNIHTFSREESPGAK